MNHKDIATRNRQPAWIWIPLVFWVLLIFTVSSIPGDELPKLDVINEDKLAHVAVYLVLGYLAMRSFNLRRGLAGSTWFVLILCVAYGISDELHQHFVPGRTPSILDGIADAVGAALGIGLWNIAARIRRKKSGSIDQESNRAGHEKNRF